MATSCMLSAVRMALLRDYPEEDWPSMDLVAEMLHAQLHPNKQPDVRAELLCPTFHRLFGRLPFLGRRTAAVNADRLLNRLWLYPRALRRLRERFDAFHICDHSYSQLLHALPAERTGVYCHDLDTFRCLLEPDEEPRPRWFKAMVRHILNGFQKAAIVFYTTHPVREQILKYGLIDPERLVHAPNGVAQEFIPEATNEPQVCAEPFLLHVGSCIPRKRIDVLLAVFARLREVVGSNLRLIQVGGTWTSKQAAQIQQLRLADVVEQRRGLSRNRLAAHYRQAQLVLQPSEAEGFGLPVIEALACGTGVIASDIPVLREVGDEAIDYAPVGDVNAWVEIIAKALIGTDDAEHRRLRLEQASYFSWERQAATIVEAYRRLLS